MADLLDGNGLTLETYSEILSFIKEQMNAIYAVDGDTINFDSETPDGQFTNILAQISADARQLAAEIYNSFNPDNCQGVLQDQRYALNYITRGAGTYTIQDIDITTDRTVELEGLDTNYNDPTATAYTVSDNAGNQWYLIESTTIEAETKRLPFRSQNLGFVQPTIGTITNQVTKVLGVTAVNNSVGPLRLGRDEESDADFRIRRDYSTAIKGQNNYDTMLGQLLSLNDVTDARIFVNNTNNPNTTVTDITDGIPARTIWVIVEGGSADDIGNVIYQNSAGLPTFGSVSVDITTNSMQTLTINYDEDVLVPFYIKFEIRNTAGLNITNEMKLKIKNFIVDNLRISMGQPVETSEITNVASQALLEYDTNIYALDVQISTDNTNWTDYIASTSLHKKFKTDNTRITITVV